MAVSTEKVENGLKCCTKMPCSDCDSCPYEKFGCKQELLEDALASITALQTENKRLQQNYDDVYNFKRKLENELIERGFAEYAHGNFRILSDDEKAEVRKTTATEIIQDLYNCCELQPDKKINNTTISNYGKNKFGVEVNK